MFVLFNNNKKFIGYSPDAEKVNDISAYSKEIPEQFSNLNEWHWEGDYDNGKMISNKKFIELTEEQKAIRKIIDQYPLGVQLINIIKQLNVLSKNANLFDNDYKEMSNNIMEIMSGINK